NGADSDGSETDAGTTDEGETTEGSEASTTDGDESGSEGDSATTTTTGAAAVEPVVELVSVEVQASSEDEKTKVNVYVDKKKVGSAPIVLDLKPGKHTLELKSRGHRNIKRTLNVVAGKKIKPITVKLKKRPDPINHNIEIDPEDGPATVIQM
ncbi:MAG: PEGA domain-containing protein, partial [Nannocystaceae bacterium]